MNSETKVKGDAFVTVPFVYITVQLHRFSLAYFVQWR